MEEKNDARRTGFSGLMRSKVLTFAGTTVVSGFGMWVVAGLYHNLVLPMVEANVQAHHEGLDVMLYSYFLLAALMLYLYTTSIPFRNRFWGGIVLGIAVGVLWTLPHGLVVAGIHGTSILREFLNSLWHVFEQGIGGLLMALVMGKKV